MYQSPSAAISARPMRLHLRPFNAADCCNIAKYCSTECQESARNKHDVFCRAPSAAQALEQQAVSARIDSGQGLAPNLSDHMMSRLLQREFVLASGERTLATSGSVPPFSVFLLPDHFEWAWPMHVLLPHELSPLNAPFVCKTTMHEFKQVSPAGPDPLRVQSIEGALAKFVSQVPCLYEAMRSGQPEASTLWRNGCNATSLLPLGVRSNITAAISADSGGSRRTSSLRTASGSPGDQNGCNFCRRRRGPPFARPAAAQQGANFFVLRMPDSPI